MFDDLNENNNNLTEDATAQGDVTSSSLVSGEGEQDANSTIRQEQDSAAHATEAALAQTPEVPTTSGDEVAPAQTPEVPTSSGDEAAPAQTPEVPTSSGDEAAPASGTEDGVEPTDTNASSQRTEENNSISSDLIRGHINTIILRALYERDKYGYEIINDIESKSHGQYTLKQPTLYSALKRLESQGYIQAYWKTDEVTLGGRRKYFRLTESGKAITERNLSEWEYSRTIIDSLISDRSFDFSRPAPTAVDFTLLRDSVTRVPTVRAEDRPSTENNQSTPAAQAQQPVQQQPVQAQDQQPVQQQPVQAQDQQPVQQQPVQVQDQQPVQQPVQAQDQQPVQQQPVQAQDQQPVQQQPVQAQDQQPVQQQPVQAQDQQPVQQQPVQPQAPQPTQESEEEIARRRTHENYMRLISEPVRQTPTQVEDTVPGSENINSDRLLYNNRPETERDYRNLIDSIFFRTVNNGSVQTTYHSRQSGAGQPPRPSAQPRRTANTTSLVDRGANDGVSITPSNERNSSRAEKTTYNKGITLLKSSAVVFAILIVEAILCYIFMEPLAINWIYPAVILGIGIIQFAVFAIMALNGFGKHSVLPTSHGYISSCIILTIIIILIIAVLSFLLNMNMAILSDILKMLVIPSVTALNLTVFALCYRGFIK